MSLTMHRFSILFLLVCLYCLSSSAVYCFGQTAVEPAVKRLVLRQVTVNWDPAHISLEAEWKGELTQQLHVMNWRKSEGSALPRVYVNNDGRMIISGSPDAIFNSLLHGTRTLLVGPSPSEAEYQVDLPPIRLTSIKDRRLSDGRIEVDLSVEGLLPRFQVHAKIEADDPADKKPPKISSPKLDEHGRHAITVTLPALRSDAHVVYQLAVSNRDGSRSRTIGLNRVGPRLDRNVPKVAEASPCPAWDSSKLATAEKPGQVTQPKNDGSEGPLGALHRPPTAEQRIDARSLPCSVRVNWKTNTIQVAGKLLSESGDQKEYHLVSASTHAGSEERLPPVVRVERGTLEFEATVDSLREHLVPGTRSLWLVSARWRA